MDRAATHKPEPREDQQVTVRHGVVRISCEPKKYLSTAWLIGSLLAILLQSCAGPIHPPRPVCENCRIVCGECEEQDRFVRLQGSSAGLRQDRLPNFSHPIKLRPEDWKIILSSLRVRREGEPVVLFSMPKGPISDALTQDEIEYLSRTLSLAFAQAQPTEWVVFGLSRSRAPEVSEITSGGWFMEGTHLHLFLANYRFAVTAPNIRELVWENPLSSQVNLYEFVPGDHQTVIQVKEGGLLRSPANELSIAYQPLLLADPMSKSAVPNGSASSLLPQIQSEHLSIEERLKTLKRLRDQGLITEEEYRIKRGRLLEQL